MARHEWTFAGCKKCGITEVQAMLGGAREECSGVALSWAVQQQCMSKSMAQQWEDALRASGQPVHDSLAFAASNTKTIIGLQNDLVRANETIAQLRRHLETERGWYDDLKTLKAQDDLVMRMLRAELEEARATVATLEAERQVAAKMMQPAPALADPIHRAIVVKPPGFPR